MKVIETETEIKTRFSKKFQIKFHFTPKWVIIYLLLIVVMLGLYHSYKPLPVGIEYMSPQHIINESDIKFLYDLTYNGQVQQSIFDQVFQTIDEAEQYILIDMFLFNAWQQYPQSPSRNLSSELAQHLIAKKQANPNIKIDFITDPINTLYGAERDQSLVKLSEAGINVVITDLTKLRDSNSLYSAWWRTFISYFGNSNKHGYLPHPFSNSSSRVSLRTYLSLLNFKANHRKIMIADNQGQLVTMITSANPHDASFPNSNVALMIRGPLAESVYQSEKAVADFSGIELYSLPDNLRSQLPAEQNKYAKVNLITERQIKFSTLITIASLNQGDSLDLAMFYLSDRDIVRAINSASERGVTVRLILDANRDAFGYQKPGIPNRATAKYLHDKSDGKIAIRWYLSQGEQFHTKMIRTVKQQTRTTTIILGSANLTRRNLDNYNLETNVIMELNNDWNLAGEFDEYFKKMWHGEESQVYTQAYGELPELPWYLTLMSALQEFTGLSSF